MLSHSLLKPRVGLTCERPRLTKGLAQPRLPAQRRPALRAARVQAAATGSDNVSRARESSARRGCLPAALAGSYATASLHCRHQRWPCPPQANEFKPSARDLALEAGRKKMRDVFDVDRWVVHRSQSRYFRHLLALPQ